jgi:hypothetical protein
MTFGRWIKQAPYSPHCGALAHIPHASRMAHLPLAEQYACAELFRGTMVRHSAIVYRDDGSGAVQATSFEGNVWLQYVPVRMSETICVQERLPPGAAAVLINQNHTYSDLFMTINPIERHLFDAVDGHRTIADILRTALPFAEEQSRLDTARAFFERLWWHDQVVFDASATKGRSSRISRRSFEMGNA